MSETDDLRSRLEAALDKLTSRGRHSVGCLCVECAVTADLRAVLTALPVAPPPDLVALRRDVEQLGFYIERGNRPPTLQAAHELRRVRAMAGALDAVFASPLPAARDTAPARGGRWPHEPLGLCFLNVDSPSYPPDLDEYRQCDCRECRALLAARDTAPAESEDRNMEFYRMGKLAGDLAAQVTDASNTPPNRRTASPAPEGMPAKDYKALYHELLYQVSTKHPNETRHETALRYLRTHDSQCGQGGPTRADAPRDGGTP